MCGIVGAVTTRESLISLFAISLENLAKRGPDSEGLKKYQSQDNFVIFGHRRLAIIDLQKKSNQPLEDIGRKLSIIFNGEIYNYQSLRKILIKKGHRFKTESDTEVILEGYKEYGTEIVEKLEGMFAFGLFDKEKNILLIGRDHFGKKPLYYYHDANNFIFASELKALKPLLPKLTLDNKSLLKYFIYGYVPSPHTIYSEVKKLPASSYKIISTSTLKEIEAGSFWRLESIEQQELPLSEAIEKTDKLIRQAVKQRLVADVPVGTFLSGGIDSSLVTTISAELHPGIETFSVTYEDKKFDESEYVKLVGDRLNISYNLINFSDSDAEDILDEVLDYIDEPMADASLLPTTFVAKHTRRKVTVALSGDGGDEIFGGYPKYNAQLLAENSIIKFLMKASILEKGIDGLPIDITKKQTLRKFQHAISSDPHMRHFIWGSGSFTVQELQKLTSGRKTSADEIFEDSKYFADLFQQKDFGNLLLFLDAKIQLPDWYLVKVDRAAMSQSLEVRSPLLDKRLAEFVFSLSSSLKFSTRSNKVLLKEVAKKYLPEKVINRKKMGFGLPLNKWLQTIFKEQVDEVLNALDYEGLDKKYIMSLWKDELSGSADNATKIWRLFILGVFLKKL